MSHVRVFDLTRQDDTDPLARLFALADMVRRIPPPDHRNPEAFHICRSELANEIESTLRKLEGQ